MRLRLYNPAQLAPDELKASFIARKETLEELLRVIRQQKPGRPCQHFLLIGPRGMGKTTLGLRFLLSIKEDPELAAIWQTIAFHEESYGIGDLADFWFTALHHLSRATDEPRWAERADALREDESDTERQAAYARAALRDFCQENGKRLVLFVENLDVLFGQLGGEREVHTLRADFIERTDILLVGSANTVFEAIRGHGEPFYEFFRLFILEGLGQDDTRRMLAAFGDGDGNSDLPEALHRERGRLETVRRLTGGNPRLLVLACRMLIESPLGSPLEDLERLIDEQTPYFKARIEELPVQGRRVFHCLAAGWRPMLAKEVADAAKLSSSHASAQLRQLIEKGYAREIKLPREKRVRYEIVDRFYNIYHLLRFSRTGRHRLEQLVHFLHDLFGPTGMRAMYPVALDALREQGPPSEEMSDWLGILAGYVASDEEFGGREEWRRNAVSLINETLGTNSPVIREIEQAFAGRHTEDSRQLLEMRNRGAEQVRDERFADAEAVYRELILETPDDAIAWLSLGTVLFLQDRFDEAVDACDRVAERVHPHDPDRIRVAAFAALLIKTHISIQLEQSESAFLALELVSDYADSDDSPPLRHVVARLLLENGRALAKLDRHDETIAALELCEGFVRSDDPTELRFAATEALAAWGQVLLKLGRFDEATIVCARVTDYLQTNDPEKMRNPGARALGIRGTALLNLARYEDAATAFQRVSEYVRPSDPTNFRKPIADILSTASRWLNIVEKYSESEATCRKATELEPTHGEAWRVLAEAFLGQDRDQLLAEAEDCARRALDLEPEDASIIRTLSDVFARRGNWREVVVLLERAAETSGSGLQTQDWPGLTESLISVVAAGLGPRLKALMEKAGLVEPMEPLWHAIRAELGEGLEPLPAEIMDTVTEIRKSIAERRKDAHAS